MWQIEKCKGPRRRVEQAVLFVPDAGDESDTRRTAGCEQHLNNISFETNAPSSWVKFDFFKSRKNQGK
jgi:hypothetical protein